LAWNKNVYREWFRFAQLAAKYKLPYPEEFGDLSKYSMDEAYIDIHERSEAGRLRKTDDKAFEKWWKEKKDLFYEPPETARAVTKMRPSNNHPKDNHFLYLQVDLRDLDKAMIEYHKMMVKIYNYQQEKGTKFIFQSKAKFHPSLPPQNIKLQKLTMYRLAYDLFSQGKSRTDIVIELINRDWMKEN
jgi:hypothetical protein